MKSNARYNELQFITGLKHARKILLALKETKLAESNRVELKSKQENRSTEPRQQTTQANQPEDTLPTIKPIVAQPIAKAVTKKQELSEKINQLGLELSQTNLQVESYSVIFHKLAEHYGNKLHLLEDNSYLKSQSEEYKRQIEEQLSKIKSYEKLIVDIPKQNEAVQREIEGIVRQYLKQIEVCNTVQVSENHNRLDRLVDDLASVQLLDQEGTVETECRVRLNLNYKALKEQVTRKVVPKKTKGMSADQSTMQKFYQAQISSF